MSSSQITIGKDGPSVESIGTGLMSLGHAYGNAGDDETRLKYLDDLYALGSHHWDTADIYGDCESLVGKWFAKNPEKRKDIFIATKFGIDLSGGHANMKIRTDPEYVKMAFERSIKNLGLDYVDLYYAHRVDGVTPIETTIKAMVELKNQGKIKHIGLSEVSAKTLRRAHAVHPISALQIEYSPFVRFIESNGILDTCKELGITVVAYSPLGRGFLTGSIKSPKDLQGGQNMFPLFAEENFHKNYELVKRIESVTEKVRARTGNDKITQAQVVLAWDLRQAGGHLITPIPGTRTISRVEENMGSIKVELTDEEDRAITQASDEVKMVGDRYPAGMDHWQLGETPELSAAA